MSRDEDGQVDDVADNGHGVDVDKDGLVEILREVTLEGGDEGDREFFSTTQITPPKEHAAADSNDK